ncbi:Six-hairpin glycosidase-like protein [Spinellus fusiger]|nr:Six-hairpin glycosidase-like protein [Spinellus fusiger]
MSPLFLFMNSVEQTYIAWRGRYLRTYKDGLYIYYKEQKEGLSEMTCSEAHGYGMLVSVLKRNQLDFDGLLRYFLQWRNKKGLMQWQQKVTPTGDFVPGDQGGDNCATDGDVDIATALFLAAKVWGRGGAQGELDYRAIATHLCASIWEHCIHHETHMPLIGDWASPGEDAFLLTRPSDFILSGYLIFSLEDGQRRQQWENVLRAILSTVQGQLTLNPRTGLLADFLKLDAKTRVYMPARGEVLESSHDGDYNWNSCRVPWRLGHYYMLTRDERVRQVLETQAQFFAAEMAKRQGGHGDCAIRAGYTLSGHSYADYTDMAFVAPVSFLFWCLGWQNQMHQVTSDMNQMEKTYFGDSIAILCLLMAHVPY